MIPHIRIILSIAFLLITSSSFSQEYFVDPIKGKDTYEGTEDRPFRLLSDAVKIANEQTGSGNIMIRLMPGTYLLEDKVLINPVRIFNDTSSFIIEAFHMPDDGDWSPEKMPMILSTSPNNSETLFKHAVGLLVASDHVHIRGLKFLGNPNPSVNYYYPITKEDKSLEDLEVSQCMFIGDKEAGRIQGGIWAHGPNNSVDHCVFYECRNAVLFFDNVQGFQISNSIITKSYESAFWFGPEDVEFDFFNNLIFDNHNFLVVRSAELKYSSPFRNSILANNGASVGYWSMEKGQIMPIKTPNIQFDQISKKFEGEILENEEAAFPQKQFHLKTPLKDLKKQPGIFKN